MEDPDSDVVAAVLAGDRERFRVLVDRHGSAVLGFLKGRTRDGELARELFQETWVRALVGLVELRDPTRVRAWLVSIAHNTLRQRLARVRVELEDSVQRALEPAGETESSALESTELAVKTRRAVDALPRRQREVFLLRVQQELSHADVARELGITEENSRAHFYQAIKHLRSRLEGLWP